LDEPSLWEGAHHAAIPGACRKRRSILILRLLCSLGPTLLDASLDIEDLSATRLHNAELTLSESFKFPRAGQRESISINGSRLFIWFFRHQPGKGLMQSF
jgi:hypothetical protein